MNVINCSVERRFIIFNWVIGKTIKIIGGEDVGSVPVLIAVNECIIVIFNIVAKKVEVEDQLFAAVKPYYRIG